jgi:hypothetical protein
VSDQPERQSDAPPASTSSKHERFMRVPHTDRDASYLWDDDRRLAWWIRLRMAADQAFPAMPDLPRVPDDVLAALVAAGEVEVAGLRYRCPTIMAEREEKQASAVAAANRRWDKHRAAQRAKADADAYAAAYADADAEPYADGHANETQRTRTVNATSGDAHETSPAAPAARSVSRPRRVSAMTEADREQAERDAHDESKPEALRREAQRQLSTIEGTAA